MDLSIIIPFKDNFEELKETINSVLYQKTKVMYEVIIVDDGSKKDHSEDIKKINKKIVYIYKKNGGPASARNIGISKARSKNLAFIDSDCIADKEWINQIIKNLKKKEMILGGETTVDIKNKAGLASQFLTKSAMTDTIKGKETLIFLPTCNFAMQKSVVEKIGLFDEDFPLPAGEDLEFCWRAYKKDIKLNYNKKMIVRHNIKDSLVKHFKQAYRYGKGNYLVQIKHQDHPELRSIRLGSKYRFYSGCLIDLMHGPIFSYVFTKRLNKEYPINFFSKMKIFLLYFIHKVAYVAGNIDESKKH